MKNQKKACIYALSAILFWSTVASAFKISLREGAINQLLFYAVLSSLAVLLLILVLRHRAGLILLQTPREIAGSAILGLLNPFLYYIILLNAYDMLPAQEAMTLNYIWPVMLVILSVPVLKERLRASSLLSICISFAGVIIIATGGRLSSLEFANPAGTALALSSSVVWALFWLFSARDRRDETVRLFTNFLFGFIYILIWNICTDGISLPGTPALAGSVYIGLFEMGITFVLWSLAMTYTESTALIGNLIFLSPFMSLMFISLIVGEEIELSTLAGLIFIIAGIIAGQYSGNKSQEF